MNTTPQAPTQDEALTTLRSVLEAWQQGEKPQTLSEWTPAVAVADRDWARGARLVKFEIEEDHIKPAGYDLSIGVKLWLENGKQAPQKARFTVSTAPALVVVRAFGA
jgi:hypothetical protein